MSQKTSPLSEPSTSSTPSRAPRRPWVLYAAVAAGLIAGGACLKLARDGQRASPPATAAADGRERKQTPPAIAALAEAIQGPAAAPSSPPSPSAPAALGSCAQELESIRKIYRGIPRDFRQAVDMKKVTEDVQECRRLSEAFLAHCRTPDNYEVQFVLARLLLNLNRVAWTEFIQQKTKDGVSNSDLIKMRDGWAKKYFGRIIDLAGSAAGKAPPGSVVRADSLDLLGDALLQSAEPKKALERYELLLKEFPAYEDRASVYQGMAQAHQDLGTCAEGIVVIRKALAEIPDDAAFPFFHEWLFKLYSAAGDLPGLLKEVNDSREALPARARGPEIGKVEKETCERLQAYSGFRLGYARFALGDLAGAVQGFREHIDFLEALEKQMGSLPQDYRVYKSRSEDNLAVLESKIGKTHRADLTKVHWSGARRLALDGRPLALVFRNYGDDRSAPFLQALDRHAREKNGSYELAAISFLKGAEDVPLQTAETMREARELKVDCAVGLDADAREKSLFSAFNATVGSATFVVVDRRGTYLWFQQDPRPVDVKFSIAILERILAAQ